MTRQFFYKPLSVLLFLLPLLTFAMEQTLREQHADRDVILIYHMLKKNEVDNVSDRINFISGYFKDRPYLLGPLGEGLAGKYDQSPLYRTDRFDCLTYVETVLALAFGSDLDSFQQLIKRVRYTNGEVSFVTRNHFTETDWNKNSQQWGYLEDITPRIHDQQGQSIAEQAEAIIDKPTWYQKRPLEAIKVQKARLEERNALLDELREEGSNFEPELAVLAYIPLSVLFDEKGQQNDFIFRQIPNAAVIEIVRPNWDLTERAGTHLNVSHIGFAIRQDNKLYFRDASSEKQVVADTLFVDYLKRVAKSPTIKGINIQIVI